SISGIWMSRKSRSGAMASNARRVSRPLRLSPITDISVYGDRSCRTPRRASGSSSATSTRILRIAPRLMIRQANGGDYAAAFRVGYLDGSRVSVQDTQAGACIGQAHALRGGNYGRQAGSVVAHGNYELLVLAPGDDFDQSGIPSASDPVAQR